MNIKQETNVLKTCTFCNYERKAPSYSLTICSKCSNYMVSKEKINHIKKNLNNIEYQICIECGYKIESKKYEHIRCPNCNMILIEENDGLKIKKIHEIKEKSKKYGLN